MVVDGVTTRRLDQIRALEAKFRMEREEPNGKCLLDAQAEEPVLPDGSGAKVVWIRGQIETGMNS